MRKIEVMARWFHFCMIHLRECDEDTCDLYWGFTNFLGQLGLLEKEEEWIEAAYDYFDKNGLEFSV